MTEFYNKKYVGYLEKFIYFKDNINTMSWVNIADDWVQNSIYSIRANQLPFQGVTFMRLPLSDNELLSDQGRRNMSNFFKNSQKYIAFALPDKDYEITPSLYFYNIDSYSEFVRLNNRIKDEFDDLKLKSNNGLPPLTDEKELRLVFIRDYYDEGALWFSIKRIDDNRIIFKYFPGERPRPFFVSKNMNAVVGIIDIENKKITVNSTSYLPKILSVGLKRIASMPTLGAIEKGYTYDAIVLQKQVPVKTIRHTKSYVVISSMIPNDIIVKTIKELHVETTSPDMIKSSMFRQPKITVQESSKLASIEAPIYNTFHK